jgi:cell division protein FtsL
MDFDYKNTNEDIEEISKKKPKRKKNIFKKFSKKSLIISFIIIFISMIFFQENSYKVITKNLAEIQKTITHIENIYLKKRRTSKTNTVIRLKKELYQLELEILENSKYWNNLDQEINFKK